MWKRQMDVDTFVMDCLNMRGPASSMELFAISYKLQTQLGHALQVIGKLDHAGQPIYIQAAQQAGVCRLPMIDRVRHPIPKRSLGKL